MARSWSASPSPAPNSRTQYYACGRYHAYVCGWFLALGYLSIIPLNATALALLGRFIAPTLFARGYLYSVAGFDVYLGEVVLASAAVVLVGVFNYRSVRSVGDFQLVLTTLLTGTVLVLAVGSWLSPMASLDNLMPAFAPERTPLAGILAMVAIAPWLYVGFDTLPQAAEELTFSHRQSLRLMVVAILAGAFMYIAVLLATAVVGPWEELIAEGSPWLTGTTVRRSLGTAGLTILAVAVAAGILHRHQRLLSRRQPPFVQHGARESPAERVRPDPSGTPHTLCRHSVRRRVRIVRAVVRPSGSSLGGRHVRARHGVRLRVHVLRGLRARAEHGRVSMDPASRNGGIYRLHRPFDRPRDARVHVVAVVVALGAWVTLGLVFFVARADAYRSAPEEELDARILRQQ